MKRDEIDSINPKDARRLVLGYLEERFGLEAALFDGFGLYLASKGRVYLGPSSIPGNLKIITLGILIARLSGTVKPSTNLLQAFGRHVKRNAVRLSRGQAIEYAKGADVRVDGGEATDGYVLLTYEGVPLGCGQLTGGVVKNLLPKAKRLSLKHI